ncbi:insulinase family protein [Peribacillus psychrosaccharolyticus]|uniref:Insulinase family protein n=1 Tax=Peribacillus psychrosaccharolyticus TaxID=1407 RepID=A0A974S1A2_PERPY|nr:pitrilysin family protein [Peribacillus psychrosaccharolyticus]MEC2053871.1 pitrilysin family protein [Peribacillus psychrosaccharolyticus]MED3742515.1 pitrilysin family protein [Peribacillus psychrosaccharolyticus]QQT01467.1 insulinase family protein [Peribacillus psychrosaccharolyticus]
MEKIKFDQLQEEILHETMANGLEVYIIPKKGFNKSFATFTTKYGSIDNHFVPLDKDDYTKVPDGIAHFLEHKLFEKEDGDVFQQFSKQGASGNAFTSFTRTAYLFSSTSEFELNLKTLIDFVQDPYFSEKTVEKEKGIIGQEINMYDDNPDWRLYFGTIQNMYHHHPVKIDIAGTIDSIAGITKDMLYECYHTFYHPSNMLLFIVGEVNGEEIMDGIRSNQESKDYQPQPEVKRQFEEEPSEVAVKKSQLKMNVQTPKVMLGIKARHVNLQGKELLKTELSANILLEMLFGKSSSIHESLYSAGLIDQSFSYDYTQEQGFGFALLGGDTLHPDELSEKLTDLLLQAKTGTGLDEKSLERIIKKKIGSFLRSLNSPEYIANQFTRYAFNDMNLFDVVPILEQINFDDIKQTAETLIDESQITVCQVIPK